MRLQIILLCFAALLVTCLAASVSSSKSVEPELTWHAVAETGETHKICLAVNAVIS